MRSLILSVAIVATLLAADPARADDIVDKPWSVGFHLGFSTATPTNDATKGDYGTATTASFNMVIPAEYSFKIGPGVLVPGLAFALSAGKGGDNNVFIAIPMRLRYKFRPLSAPFYVYPLFEIGPTFHVKSGTALGLLRVGAGLSYLVHPMVELVFEPLGLGGVFNSDFSFFTYTMLLGLNVHF